MATTIGFLGGHLLDSELVQKSRPPLRGASPALLCVVAVIGICCKIFFLVFYLINKED